MPQIATVPALARIESETPLDAPAVESLVLAAFGPGRFAKTAERLREGAACVAGFVIRDGDRIIGSVRLWSVRVADRPALFLGPIAVAGDSRRAGLGADLVAACVDHARSGEAAGVLLVGEPYFERFGFVHAPEIEPPGPVDRRRLFWLPLAAAAPPTGPVRAVS